MVDSGLLMVPSERKMKRNRPKTEKPASKIERQPVKQRIRRLRGKYRHLDLMKGLIDARKGERQAEEM